MNWNRISVWLAAAPLLLAGPAGADEVAEKGREVFNRNSRAVVSVQLVTKLTTGRGSREMTPDITGTVIDPSGLTVVALSSCDPYELSRRMAPEARIETEISNVRILLNDGTELPSDIVLRDRDLDLAFIRPKTRPAQPMTAVDLTQAGTAQVLDQVVALNRLNKAASRAYAASIERITAVIQKPRTFYVPDSTMTATESGAPAFTLDGKMLGLFVMRSVPGGGPQGGNVTAIILPTEDILKGAKQAPEPRADGEKKDEPKPEAK
jgi:hypothetical protein